MTALGLDCGGGECRWLLLDGTGQVVTRGTGPRLSGHLFDPAERETAMAALGTLCADIRAAGTPVEAVVAGVTGLAPDGPERRVLAQALAAMLEVAVERIEVRDDLWLAYHAAFAPGDGILVYAGTGSAACHVDADGRVWRAGGRGCLIDDAGSGFWIGRRALQWMMRQADRTGRMPTDALADALLGRIGGRDWEAVQAHVYSESRQHVAMLALAVAEAAEQGDPTAVAILGDAGQALADLALTLIDRVGLLPVALAGRAAGLHPILFQTFQRALAVPEARLTAIDPAATAARLALERR